jgi:hypothetical protein
VARIEAGMAKKGKGNKGKKAEKAALQTAEKAAKAELKLAKKEAKQAKKKAKDPDVVAESEPEPELEPEPEPAELTQGAAAPADLGESAGIVGIPPRKTATQLQAEVSARIRPQQALIGRARRTAHQPCPLSACAVGLALSLAGRYIVGAKHVRVL